MELAGKVAIVTGGVGDRPRHRGRARPGGQRGGDRRSAPGGRGGFELAANPATEPAGGARAPLVIGITTDVSSEASVAAMAAEAAQRLGGIDILVNNAALFAETTAGPFEQIPTKEWRAVLEVNVLGPYLCARAVVASMRERGGGAIVNLASGTVFKGVPGRLHYVTSKGAVVAFTRSLASELGKDNIRVNAIAPGFTLSEGVLAHEDAFSASRHSAPGTRSLQRDQLPADVAGAARFLCGPAAGFITGQTLVVDGGSAFH